MFLLFLVVCGVIALVVVKVVKPNAAAIQAATPDVIKNATNTALSNIPGVNHRHRALLMERPAAGQIDSGGKWRHWITVPQQQQDRPSKQPCLGHQHHSTQHQHNKAHPHHQQQQQDAELAAVAKARQQVWQSSWLYGLSSGRWRARRLA
jgi:ABC-type nickel/cobalt efflux system permease component RcnA